MTDLPIWAQDKAREWLRQLWPEHGNTPDTVFPDRWEASLAALLLEVEEQEHACGDHIKAALDEQMAEVRRVVEEEVDKASTEYGPARHAAAQAIGAAILARLERVDTPRSEEKP